MPCPLQIFSQSDYTFWIVDINLHTEWQTVQIQISWLLQKPTDLDLHCLQRLGISGFSRTRDKKKKKNQNIISCSCHWPSTFTTVWANSADDKLVIFCLFFPESRIWHFMQIVLWRQFAWNVKFYFLGQFKQIYFKRLSAEIFTQHAKHFPWSCWTRICPDFANIVLHCLSFSMWIKK